MTARARKSRHAFTLVELLVVVAIIIALLAILLPSMGRAIGTAELASCQSNHRQIGAAWLAYAADHLTAIVGSYTNTPGDWVANPGVSPERLEHLENGALWKYLGDPEVYKCPSDQTSGYIRSYSLSNKLGGRSLDASHLITPVHRIAAIEAPSQTFLSIDEYDRRGYNQGSFALHAHTSVWKDYWKDYPAHFHFGDTVALGFADGHSESYQLQDPSTLTLTTHSQPSPNNPDLYYLERLHDPTNF